MLIGFLIHLEETAPMNIATSIFVSLAIVGLPARADDAKKDLVGTWSWSWKDAQGEKHNHVLEVELAGESLVGRERFDDQEAVKVTDLKLSKKKVTFSVLRGESRAAYEGTLDAPTTINGKVVITRDGQDDEYGWTARKEAPKKP
jgi:hypothetical protein